MKGIESFVDRMHNLVILDYLSEGVVKGPDMEGCLFREHTIQILVCFVNHNCFRESKGTRMIASTPITWY